MSIETTLGVLVASEPQLAKAVQFYRAQQEALIRRHGVERDTTPEERAQSGRDRIIVVAPDQLEAFQRAMTVLGETPVTI